MFIKYTSLGLINVSVNMNEFVGALYFQSGKQLFVPECGILQSLWLPTRDLYFSVKACLIPSVWVMVLLYQHNKQSKGILHFFENSTFAEF